MAASQKTTWEAPSLAELPKLPSPTTKRICVRTRSRRPSSRLSPAGPLGGIAYYSGRSTGLVEVTLRQTVEVDHQTEFGAKVTTRISLPIMAHNGRSRTQR